MHIYIYIHTLRHIYENNVNIRGYMYIYCMLLTTESRSARGASRHPAFMDGSLTVSQTRLPCPPCGKMRLQVLDCGDGNI